jgi:enoyl-CoA hydratase/carnithine racemase
MPRKGFAACVGPAIRRNARNDDTAGSTEIACARANQATSLGLERAGVQERSGSMALTGAMFSAEEGMSLGLVDEVTAKGQGIARAEAPHD